MFNLNSTKTVAIICIIIVVLLGVLLYANWDKLFSKEEKKDEIKKLVAQNTTAQTEE